MHMFERLAVVTALLFATAAPALAQAPQFGQPISPADFATWDIEILPTGAGLPPGRGTVAQGEAIYTAKWLSRCQRRW